MRIEIAEKVAVFLQPVIKSPAKSDLKSDFAGLLSSQGSSTPYFSLISFMILSILA